MTDLLIIGGGAAGLAAAVTAKSLGDTVLVLERMDRVGNHDGNEFANRVLSHAGPEMQKQFWRSLGLFLREEEAGRVYPVTAQASTVLDVLRFPLEKDILTGITIRRIRKNGNAWEADDGKQVFKARRIFLAGGGCAQEKLGSDGSCIRILQQMGYPSSPLRPALTQIETDIRPIRGLEGIRIKAKVTAFAGGRPVHSERGEVLFTSYGLSGVCVMQCARYVDEKGTEISLHLYDVLGFHEEEMRAELERRAVQNRSYPAERLLTGIVPPRVGHAVFLAAGVHAVQMKDISDEMMNRILQTMGDFRIQVKGLKGMESAQVTRGGISTEFFSDRTLESKKDPGLFAGGEMLDVDGDCGGFNLMFAFGCGILAGKNGRITAWEAHK